LQKLNRRDFLKLSMALPAAAVLSKFSPSLLTERENQNSRLPNIIMIVLDTMSAKNLSLYGYQRDTTPNFKRFAQRASIYHAHHSAGNYTVPGTASILTGLYPWTHKATTYSGLIARDLTQRNIFRAVEESYTRFAFSQNLYAEQLLAQFSNDIDQFLPPSSFSISEQVIGEKFANDLNAAYYSFDGFLFLENNNPPPSLVFGVPERAVLSYKARHANAIKTNYPLGLPSTTQAVYYRLEDLFDGVLSTICNLPQPYMAYIHLWGVHKPYCPEEKFYKIFLKGWKPEEKPRHPLGAKDNTPYITFHDQLKELNRYDEYITSFDFEFGRLIDQLEKDGTLDNSYVFLTADHGESCERGTQGHITPLLFEPLIHIPLMVSAPGQRGRVDIHAQTNSVDILPTLASLTGQKIPEWCEGQPLPGLGGLAASQRATFAVDSKYTREKKVMSRASVAMLKEKYKLVHYQYANYDNYDDYELYDLESDPEELDNFYKKLPAVARTMQEELLYHFELANQPFRE
jgi:arylsulfatase A-like enzyme